MLTIGGGYNGLIYNILIHVFYWFMPWFFFKSGMYYKEMDSKDLLLSSFYKLFVPYIAFNIIGIMTESIDYCIEGKLTFRYPFAQVCYLLIYGYIHANNAMWFLLTLFLAKNVFNYLMRRKIDKRNILILNLALMLFVQLLRSIEGVAPFLSIPYWLYSTNLALIFYTCGHLLREKQFGFGISVICGIVTVLIVMFDFSYISMNSNKVEYGHLITWVIGSFTAVILVNNISRYIPSRICELFAFPGRNSIVYLVCHVPIYSLIHMLNTKVLKIEDGMTLTMVYFLPAFIIMPLLVALLNTRKSRFLIGR